VAGHELAIEQGETANLEARDQPRQRDLRGIGHPAEHRLAEEGPSQLHAIKAADQFTLMPAFDRMGVAHGMEADSRTLDDIVDPGFLPIGTGEKHVVECLVARDGEAARTDPPRQ
jgi:hypothetical protein